MGEKNWRRRRKNIEEIYCGIFLFLMGKRAGLGGEGEEHEAGQKKKTANGVPLPPSLPLSLLRDDDDQDENSRKGRR